MPFITPSNDFICPRKQLRALMIRQSRSFRKGIRGAPVTTSRHGARSAAALTNLGIAEPSLIGSGGGPNAFTTSINGAMRPSSLKRHSVAARKGEICNIRLKIMEQSVGMPFEISVRAFIEPPVGKVILSGEGEGSLRSAHGGRSKSFFMSTGRGMSIFGISLIQSNGIVIRRNYPPINRDYGCFDRK